MMKRWQLVTLSVVSGIAIVGIALSPGQETSAPTRLTALSGMNNSWVAGTGAHPDAIGSSSLDADGDTPFLHYLRPGADPSLMASIDLKQFRHAPAVCFAPGTPNSVITKFQARHFGDVNDMAAYNLQCRWPGALGSPTTITWSLAMDGVSIPAQGTGPTGPNELFSRLDLLFAAQGGRATWVGRFNESFRRWGELCGQSYERITFGGNDWDDGAAWGADGDANRGDCRIGMRVIDGGNGILAFNVFPCGGTYKGEMVLDRQETWQNGTNTHRFLRNIVMHEHGHGMGLLHVCPLASTKLMEPFLALNFDGPRHDDVRACQDLYGDLFENDNSAATAADLGDVSLGTSFSFPDFPPPAIANTSILSIDQLNEQDFFRINVTEELLLTVTVKPLGLTYGDDVQACPGQQADCCSTDVTNSKTIADLGIQIRESDGTTIIIDVEDVPAGLPELVEVGLLPGEYFMRVYSDGGFNQTQLYELTVEGLVLAPCFGVDCVDDLFCNGIETCELETGDCLAGSDPCQFPEEVCNEDFGACLPAPGACCLPDGSCEVLSAASCSIALGSFVDNGVPCDPPPVPACEPASAVVFCTLSDTAAFAGTSVEVLLFGEDTGGGQDVGVYQAGLSLITTGGSGTLSVDCSQCGGGANDPDCGIRIDDGRSDYLFFDLGNDALTSVNCGTGSFGGFAISGFGTIDGTPSYLGEVTVDISADATAGTTFEISALPPGPNSFLASPAGTPFAYGTGDVCTLTVLDPGACLAPEVEAVGSKSLVITTIAGAPVALQVTGDPGDPDVSCVSKFVQADGTLGDTPVFQLPADWGPDDTIAVRASEIIPEATYNVQTVCGAELSLPTSATTGVWADVNDNMIANLEDVFLAVLGFQGDFIVSLEALDVDPCVPNGTINLGDAFIIVTAFQGVLYTDLCDIPCP